MTLLKGAGLALVAIITAGCTVSIETQPPRDSAECLLARVGGVVVVDETVGVGLRAPDGVVHRVVWPFGYSAHRDFAGVTLVDSDGRTVAREGSEIATAGFTNDVGVAYPCGPVEVMQ